MFNIRTAITSLLKNRIRTFLTSLGILIGVFSVVVLVAFGLGLRDFVQKQFESLGSNLLVIFPGQLLDEDGNFKDQEAGFGSPKFTQTDAVQIARLPQARAVAPAFLLSLPIESDTGEKTRTQVFGSNVDNFTIRNFEAGYGRLYSETDVRKGTKVAVLGEKVAEKLFGSSRRAVGGSIRINDQYFQVIGTLKPKGSGSFGGPDFDSYVFVPFSAGGTLNPSEKFFVIYAQANKAENIASFKSEIKKVLGNRLKEDDFSVIESTEVLGAIQSIFGVLNTVLVAIGSISLVVGGIGIMNIMYATVNERIKEIGIRRALGATKEDILWQFLIESVIVSLIGGVLGLAFAWVVALIVNRWIPVTIDTVAVSVALGVSSAVGIIFGVFPARRAANWPPIQAIRH